MIRPRFSQSVQHFCSKNLCTRHVLFLHVSFTNTDFVRISYYHPSSPHLPFLNTAHLVFSSFLPPLAPLFFALSKSDSCLTEKEKKKTNPPSSSCSHASQVGLSIPLLYLPGPVFHRNVFLVRLTSSPCLMHWQIYSDWRRELGLKWKVSAE